MRRTVCALISLWLNVRYAKFGLLSGYLLDGHDFKGNGEVCCDHWHIVCERCGLVAATEVDPTREFEL